MNIQPITQPPNRFDLELFGISLATHFHLP
jgi:hypothetical protein